LFGAGPDKAIGAGAAPVMAQSPAADAHADGGNAAAANATKSNADASAAPGRK
jgi:hypothetical protein